jgi:signal transduction histidine kinase
MGGIGRLTEEQAALRRVATLVAEGASQPELFAAVAEQVAAILPVPYVSIVRFEPDGTATERAHHGVAGAVFEVGTRWSLDGPSVVTMVLATGRPARIDAWEGIGGEIADAVRAVGITSTVGIPIVVAGRLWGVMVVSSDRPDPLPADTESHLTDFTELVATVIANSEARAELDRLASEQAALRRVATLVAEERTPDEMYAKVLEEVGTLLDDVDAELTRFESDGTATVLAVRSKAAPPDGIRVGIRIPLGGDNVTSMIQRTGRTARIDDYATATGEVARRWSRHLIRSAAGVPVVVHGRLWGSLVVAARDPRPMPDGTEARVAEFTELLGTAIANADARTEVTRLADEQAALRRVATLVAQGGSPTDVFTAAAAEVAQLLDAELVALGRFDEDTVEVVAVHGDSGNLVPVGIRLGLQGDTVAGTVRRTGRSARIDDFDGAHGPVADLVRRVHLTGSVGAPVTVDGNVWGVIITSWTGGASPPPDTEARLAQFAELLDTAIANADARAQLTASRVRMLAAEDAARRRVVRDLHDGAQQRLVQAIATLRLARRALAEGDPSADGLVDEALENAEQGNAELRELAHGILPAVLTQGGLRAGVGTFVGRLALPVTTELPATRFAPELEASAYFVIAEALTNVVKHSQASAAEVRVAVDAGRLKVEIRDDGIGGADPEGHGLIGIGDRVVVLGGSLQIESPPGGGTTVTAAIPVAS